MKVTIKEQTFDLRYTMRGLLLYENLEGKNPNPTSLNATVEFLYCIIIASNRDLVFDYDEFLDWLDEPEQVNIIRDFSEWMNAVSQMNAQFAKKAESEVKKESEGTTKKKKSKTRTSES